MLTSLWRILLALIPIGLVLGTGGALVLTHHPDAGRLASAAIGALAVFYTVMFLHMTRHVDEAVTELRAGRASGPMLGLWQEWQDNLMGGAEPRQARTPAAGLFTMRRVCAGQVNLAFYQSLPNILVGMGILFTFLGLAEALQAAGQSVVATDASEMRKGLETLFQAAAYKFSTSIAGLASSMLLVVVEKVRLDQMARNLEGLCTKLDAENPPLQFERELLVSLRASANSDTGTALREAAVALQSSAEHMQAQFTTMVELQRGLTAEAIGQQVGAAVNESFTAQLAPVFADIRDEMANLSAIKKDQGQEILANLVRELRIEVLEPIAVRIDESAAITKQASEAVLKLDQDILAVAEGMAATTHTLERFQEETLARLRDFASSLEEILGRFGGDTRILLQEVASEIRASINQSVAGLELQRSVFEESAAQAASTFVGIRDELQIVLHSQTEAQHAMLDQVRDQFDAVASRTSETFQEAARAMDAQLASQRQALSNVEASLTSLTGRTEQTLAATSDHVVRVVQAAGAALDAQQQTFSRSAADAVAAQREMLSEVEVQMDRTLTNAGLALTKTTDAVQSAVGESVTAMGVQRQAFQASAEDASRTFEALRGQLEGALDKQTEVQRAMLGEVKEQMGSVVAQANETFQTSSAAIKDAVDHSVDAMQAQRSAFQESAADAARTFSGLREDLEASLERQAALEAQRLGELQARLEKLLDEVGSTFRDQMATLEGVGTRASGLMNDARENLMTTMTAIGSQLLQTRQTVQDELEAFRLGYQASLSDFFQRQNDLLETSLGAQRDGLSEVVDELRSTFAAEAAGRARMSAEVDAAAVRLLETLDGLNRFTTAIGLQSGDRVLQIQEVAREGSRQALRVEEAYKGLVSKIQDAMAASNEQLAGYLVHAESRQTQFFRSLDDSVSKLTDGLLQTAEFLAEAEQHRRETISR